MSSSLGWVPVRPQDYKYLDDELKRALQKRYRGVVTNQILGESDIQYLEALKAAGIKGADKLISAIEKHTEIEITEVW